MQFKMEAYEEDKSIKDAGAKRFIVEAEDAEEALIVRAIGFSILKEIRDGGGRMAEIETTTTDGVTVTRDLTNEQPAD